MSKAEVKCLGVPAKYVSLAVLACQNSAVALLMRFSRSDPNERLYLSSTAVMSSEFVKLIVAVVLVLRVGQRSKRKRGPNAHLLRRILALRRMVWAHRIST